MSDVTEKNKNFHKTAISNYPLNSTKNGIFLQCDHASTQCDHASTQRDNASHPVTGSNSTKEKSTNIALSTALKGSTASFNLSGKANACPVCDDTSGACRQGKRDSDYWQCMTYADAKKGEVIGEWKSLGATKNNQWGQFKPDNSDQFTNQRGDHDQRIQQEGSGRIAIQAKRGASSSALPPVKGESGLGDSSTVEKIRSGIPRCEAKRGFGSRNKEREHDARVTGCLPPDVRHEQYKRLESELGYHPDDLRDFERRGLTEDQILLSGFRSIDPFHQLQGQYSDLLPGVKNNQLMIGEAGYLCPVRDILGRTVAYQIRVRGTDTGNRYRWLSSKKSCEGSLHLDGELPLAVHRPHGNPVGIGFVEGVGVKPFLAAHIFNLVVIGAAGGQWDGSRETLEETLTILSSELNGTKEVTFYLDAGDVLNSSVMGRWNRAEQLATELGYTVRFAWWNQIEKSVGDIDEIDLAQTEITYYSSEDFRTSVGALVRKWEKAEAIRKEQEPLRSLTYSQDLLLNTRYIPRSIIPLIPTGLIALKAPKGSGKSRLIAEIIRIESEKGKYVLSITPRIALGREQAFKWKITWIGDKGNTRTVAETSDKEDSQIKALEDELSTLRVELAILNNTPIQLSLLNSSRKSAEETDLRGQIDGLEDRISSLQSASYRRLGLCWDSLWKVNRVDMKGSLIILDEAEMGLTHLMTSSTCRRSRASILKVLGRIIPECLLHGGTVILADADLTDVAVDYINALLPTPIKPYVIVNEFTDETTRWNVTLITGSKDMTLDEIITRLRAGERLAVTTDSQAEAEALEKLILLRIPEFCSLIEDGEITKKAVEGVPCVVRIDSKNTRCDAGKTFVKHPNEEILKWQPRCLIYSPSMGIGVSIDESVKRDGSPYFDAVYGLFFRVIVPSQCRQQLARVRANVPRIVWFSGLQPTIEGCPSFFPTEVNRQLLSYQMEGALTVMDLAAENLKETCRSGNSYDDDEIFDEACRLRGEYLDKESKLWNNPHLEIYSRIKARDNYGRVNLPELLEKELREEGHEVTISIGAKTATGDVVKGFKDEAKQEEAEGIANAPDKKEDEIWKMRQNPSLKPEEEYAVRKFDLKRKVPGLELTPDYIRKALVDDHGKWLASQKLLFFVGNLEAVKARDGYSLARSLSSWAKGTAFAPDCSQILPKVKAIITSGVFDWIDLNDVEKGYRGDSPEGEAFLARCIKHRKALQRALKINVSVKSTPIDLAQKLLGKVGLQLKGYGKNGNKKYLLDADLLNDPDRTATQEAFQRAWEEGQIKPEVPESPRQRTEAHSTTSYAPSMSKEDKREDVIAANLPDESDLGESFEVAHLEGNFGSKENPVSKVWESGYKLVKLPSEFREHYIFENSAGERVPVEEGEFRLQSGDKAEARKEAVLIARRLEAPVPLIEKASEVHDLYRRCEEFFNRGLIGQALLSRVVAALGRVGQWLEGQSQSEIEEALAF